MKVVLALDFVRHGGAERVLEELHRLWPAAPVYTLLAEKHAQYADWDIRPTWLQRLVPPRFYRLPFPLYPRVVDRIRVPADADLLLSTSVSWVKSLRTPPGVKHLCYICRPMMFAYHRQEVFLARYPAALRPLLRRLVRRVAEWDRRTAGRPDQYIAISHYTADRVREAYGVGAGVIYPPVDTSRFEAAGKRTAPGNYFLTVSRLETYKRVDVLVRACTRLGLPLRVAGKGPDLPRLRSLAGPTVEFLGFVPAADLPALTAGCRAFLFSAEEDFGISPVEAQAAGRPVLAFGAGGCLETVAAGETGAFYPEQAPEALEAALEAFDPEAFDPARCRTNARRFSVEVFRRKMTSAATKLVRGAVPAESGAARGTGSSPEG